MLYESERMCNRADVICLEILSYHWLRTTEKKHENIIHSSCSPDLASDREIFCDPTGQHDLRETVIMNSDVVSIFIVSE